MKYYLILFTFALSFTLSAQLGNGAKYKEVFKIKGLKGFSIETLGIDYGPKEASFNQVIEDGDIEFSKVYINNGKEKLLLDQKVLRIFQSKLNKDIFVLLENKDSQTISLLKYSKGIDSGVSIELLPTDGLSLYDDFISSSFRQIEYPEFGQLNFIQAVRTSQEGVKSLETFVTSKIGLLKHWTQPFVSRDQSGEIKTMEEKVLNALTLQVDDYIVFTKNYKLPVTGIERAFKNFEAYQAQSKQVMSNQERSRVILKNVNSIEETMDKIIGLQDVKKALIEQYQYLHSYGEVKPLVILEGQGSLVDELLIMINKQNGIKLTRLDMSMYQYGSVDSIALLNQNLETAFAAARGGGYVSFSNWNEAPEFVKKSINILISENKTAQVLKRTSLGLKDIQDKFAQATKNVKIAKVDLNTLEGHKAVYNELDQIIQRDTVMKSLVSGKLKSTSQKPVITNFLDEDVTQAARIEIAYPQTQYEFNLTLRSKYSELNSLYKAKYPDNNLILTSRKQFVSEMGKLYHPKIDSGFAQRIIEFVKNEFAQKAFQSLAKDNKSINLKLNLRDIAKVLASDCNLNFYSQR